MNSTLIIAWALIMAALIVRRLHRRRTRQALGQQGGNGPRARRATPLLLQAAADPADARARFVWIDEKGQARELTLDECEYLSTSFHPADGARPYIKNAHDQVAPNGSLAGFLKREKLAGGTVVHPSTE